MSAPLELALAGERLQLLAERAVFLPERATLLVADAHVGKAVSFRALGVPVPRGTTTETLQRLGRLVEATAAEHVIFLGDFLHSARSHAPHTLSALARWRDEHSRLSLSLVRGNHDLHAGDPPAAFAIDVFGEPFRLGGLALCHHPQVVAGAYALAGHWHPCAGVGGRARDRLRLPCYWFGSETLRPVGVLPAFGAFTGMHLIERGSGDRVFVVAENRVAELRGPVDEPQASRRASSREPQPASSGRRRVRRS
ncbi:MAG: ligase-associated DNA damage response endonuclease PdeM [Methylibium sp.]|nr:ligase-associated DNA damage response endonuclease PdeM [Methylibium sp.]